MEPLFASTLVVALAEMGDKTQLLAILLASRFRRPWPIVAGILLATIANHALAAWAGVAVAGLLNGFWFRLAVALGFLAMAAWTLVPDKADDLTTKPGRGAFVTTLIAFFLVEIGDKTQVATVALGARYGSVALVAAGTTIGMMLANMPAVWLGERITRVVPLNIVRMVAAGLFAILGLVALIALFA
ncbi:TMEM165/GDT1 family protein [Sphingomonas jatrophae]|uniref:GDT1 family protein n=1 Tax=Sphingomonas jatrophae TaxID=1166337 RepID=A0A1I6LMP7_9SPHN|nr:TMEM165/GDT1 family protein [Sphingomonas jatrophae]SFS04764.1 Putative Ca2+/H+ antiporter, TMEM165/GDT1 family [Sphingomonas jatrophae]